MTVRRLPQLLKSKGTVLLYYAWGSALNFVEAMALSRAFSVGRFKCSKAKPKITIGEYLNDGYSLAIDKKVASKFCLSCIKDFTSERGLRTTENQNYLIIQSPRL